MDENGAELPVEEVDENCEEIPVEENDENDEDISTEEMNEEATEENQHQQQENLQEVLFEENEITFNIEEATEQESEENLESTNDLTISDDILSEVAASLQALEDIGIEALDENEQQMYEELLYDQSIQQEEPSYNMEEIILQEEPLYNMEELILQEESLYNIEGPVEEDAPLDYIEEDSKHNQKHNSFISQTLKSIQSFASSFSPQESAKDDVQTEKTFEQKQKEYLTGKVLLKDIITNDEYVVAQKGDAITEEIITTAKEKGKLIEVIMNCK